MVLSRFLPICSRWQTCGPHMCTPGWRGSQKFCNCSDHLIFGKFTYPWILYLHRYYIGKYRYRRGASSLRIPWGQFFWGVAALYSPGDLVHHPGARLRAASKPINTATCFSPLPPQSRSNIKDHIQSKITINSYLFQMSCVTSCHEV